MVSRDAKYLESIMISLSWTSAKLSVHELYRVSLARSWYGTNSFFPSTENAWPKSMKQRYHYI